MRQEDIGRIHEEPLGGFAKVADGIHTAELGGFEEGVEDRRDLGAALRLRAVVHFPADHRAA